MKRGRRQSRDQAGDRAEVVGRCPVVAQDRQWMSILLHVHARQVAPGAADGIEVAALEARQQLCLLEGLVDDA